VVRERDRDVLAATPTVLQILKVLKAEGFVRGLAMDPDGGFLAATTAEGFVALWDAKVRTWHPTARQRAASCCCSSVVGSDGGP